ncbi:MAG: M1 family metallopeptidase, partial [Acidobacteriota bacterium]
NAFANDESTFMVESGGQLRGVEIPEDGWGWIEVDSMRLAYGTDLVADGLVAETEGAEPFRRTSSGGVPGEPIPVSLDDRPDLKKVEQFISPDDGNGEDRTVARYPLPKPIQPGEWVEVEIGFSAQLPKIFARTGVHGDYVLGGQWFPKIGVFEDAGDRGRTEAGWNTHQFHADSEFFADFGDWDVRLSMPAEYAGRIGATGRLLDESVADDTVTAHFVQPGVHDFAWTASPDFIVVKDRFDPDTDVPPEQQARIAATLGMRPEELRLQPVDITLLLQPANRAQAERYIDAAKAAIRGYGLRLGAYPYATLTMVDPPRGGMGSGGMEYPTFITLGTHPVISLPGFTKLRMPDSVAVHEFGHNFFQGMIASNEFEEAWIDEGINSYYEAVVMDEHYGHMIDFFGIKAAPFDLDRLQLGDGGYSDSVVQAAWTYRPGGSYGLNSYARPAVTLRHLENLLGEETFARAMRRFFQTWRFRHPSTADFEAIMLDEANSDISWFLEQALHTDRRLDYRIRTARSRHEKDPRGWFWDEDGQKTLLGVADRHETEKQGDEEEEASERDDKTSGEEELYRSEVIVDRRGDFIHPVTVELVFDDGETFRYQWDGRSRWQKIVEVRPAKLVSAEVDPDHLMELDVDPLNNSIRLEKDRRPAAQMIDSLVFWLQNVFQLTSMVG